MTGFITLLLFCGLTSELCAQAVSIYPKNHKKIKIKKLFSIENGSIVIRDSNLVEKVIPLKSIKKIKYAQKSFEPLGAITLFAGNWILGTTLIPAVIGDPKSLYKYGGIGLVLSISGIILNHVGSQFGSNVIYYKLKGLNYINRTLIAESILLDMNKTIEGGISGQYNYKPYGMNIKLPKARWFLNLSAKKEPWGIEEWIIKNRLRERRFFEIAIPEKKIKK